MAMLISPSAVWIGFGRVPLREPLAVGVRSYRARPRKAATSSSTARCNTRRAPSRPSAARCSPSSPSPPISSSLICSSSRALGAILAILSIGVVLLSVVVATFHKRLRHLTFTAMPGRHRPPTAVDHTEKLESLRLPLPALLPVLSGVPPKLQQARLVRVQRQAKLP